MVHRGKSASAFGDFTERLLQGANVSLLITVGPGSPSEQGAARLHSSSAAAGGLGPTNIQHLFNRGHCHGVSCPLEKAF